MPVPSSTDPSLGDRFLEALQDPAALELFVLVVLGVLLVFTFKRMGRVARELGKRRELREYVRGLGHLVNCEYSAAVKYLSRVVERDPEHTDARIALGEAHYALGDGAEAHRHHYHVEQVFKKSSPRVSLCLGRDLVLLGRGEEAVQHLQRALRGEVEADAARELLVETLTDLGREREAIPFVKGPAELTSPQIGRLHAAAGFRALEKGRDREGVRHLNRALDSNPGLLAPRMALVGRRWVEGDRTAAWEAFRSHLEAVHRLAREGGVLETAAPSEGLKSVFDRQRGSENDHEALPPASDTVKALPEAPSSAVAERDAEADLQATPPGGTMILGPEEETADPKAVEDLGAMVDVILDHRAAYRCSRCGTAHVRFEDRCGVCGAFGTYQAVHEAPVRTGQKIAEAIDEIEENRYYIGRLVERLVAGEVEAEATLLRLGPKAIPEVFQRMMEVSDNRPLIAFLRKLGPDHLPLMGRAFLHMRTFGSRNILREGLGIFRSFDGIMEEILKAMGEESVPFLRESLGHTEEALQVIALKALIGLGRGDILEDLEGVVPHRDVITHMNEADGNALRKILELATPEGFLVRAIFSDRTFLREAELVDALKNPAAAAAAARSLERRGFSPDLFDALVAELKGDVATQARKMLNDFGPAALDHLVRTFTRSGLDVHRRAEVEGLLLEHGARTAEKILEELPLKNAEDMAAVMVLFQKLGDRALPALEDRYGRAGAFSLRKIGLAFGKDKSADMKADLLRLMAAVGGERARILLSRLVEAESDSDLRSLARQCLANLQGRP